MNIIKLFTRHGAVYIDSDQYARRANLLTLYTRSGKKLSEAGRTERARTEASWGVHKDNLFASPAHAMADSERILAKMATQ